MDIAELIGLICEAIESSEQYEDISSDNDNDSGEIFLTTTDGTEFVIRINEA